jgi:predicted glycosyltransferase involved in capsule biosynthesis
MLDYLFTTPMMTVLEIMVLLLFLQLCFSIFRFFHDRKTNKRLLAIEKANRDDYEKSLKNYKGA